MAELFWDKITGLLGLNNQNKKPTGVMDYASEDPEAISWGNLQPVQRSVPEYARNLGETWANMGEGSLLALRGAVADVPAAVAGAYTAFGPEAGLRRPGEGRMEAFGRGFTEAKQAQPIGLLREGYEELSAQTQPFSFGDMSQQDRMMAREMGAPLGLAEAAAIPTATRAGRAAANVAAEAVERSPLGQNILALQEQRGLPSMAVSQSERDAARARLNEIKEEVRRRGVALYGERSAGEAVPSEVLNEQEYAEYTSLLNTVMEYRTGVPGLFGGGMSKMTNQQELSLWPTGAGEWGPAKGASGKPTGALEQVVGPLDPNAARVREIEKARAQVGPPRPPRDIPDVDPGSFVDQVGGRLRYPDPSPLAQNRGQMRGEQEWSKLYSPLENEISKMRQEKMTPNQALQTLRNKGVSDQEIKETGLLDFIVEKNQAGERVTKQGLLGFVRENRPQMWLERRVYGENLDDDEIYRQTTFTENRALDMYESGENESQMESIIDDLENNVDEIFSAWEFSGIKPVEFPTARELQRVLEEYDYNLDSVPKDLRDEIDNAIELAAERRYQNSPTMEYTNNLGYSIVGNEDYGNYWVRDPNGEYAGDAYSLEEAEIRAREHALENEILVPDGQQTSWHDYVIGDPDMATYEEELLISKPALTANRPDTGRTHYGEIQPDHVIFHQRYTQNTVYVPKEGKGDFVDWEEAAEEANIARRERWGGDSERSIADAMDGVQVTQEFQSDLHQIGRRYGYDTLDESQWKNLKEDTNRAANAANQDATEYLRGYLRSIESENKAITRAHPEGPSAQYFENLWPGGRKKLQELEDVIRRAAPGGYNLDISHMRFWDNVMDSISGNSTNQANTNLNKQKDKVIEILRHPIFKDIRDPLMKAGNARREKNIAYESRPDAILKDDRWIKTAFNRAAVKAAAQNDEVFAWFSGNEQANRWDKDFADLYKKSYDEKWPGHARALANKFNDGTKVQKIAIDDGEGRMRQGWAVRLGDKARAWLKKNGESLYSMAPASAIPGTGLLAGQEDTEQNQPEYNGVLGM